MFGTVPLVQFHHALLQGVTGPFSGLKSTTFRVMWTTRCFYLTLWIKEVASTSCSTSHRQSWARKRAPTVSCCWRVLRLSYSPLTMLASLGRRPDVVLLFDGRQALLWYRCWLGTGIYKNRQLRSFSVLPEYLEQMWEQGLGLLFFPAEPWKSSESLCGWQKLPPPIIVCKKKNNS